MTANYSFRGRLAAALFYGEGAAASPPPGAVVRKAAWILLAGLAARVACGWLTSFQLNADETYQYLEAGWLLFSGSGFVSWEQAYGARFPLIPQAVALALRACFALGLDRPHQYLPVLEALFCLWSMLTPLCGWLFARLRLGEGAALWVLGALCFWWELVLYAHKPMAPFVAVPLAFVLLWLSERERGFAERPVCGRSRRFLLSFLGGFIAVWGCAVRVQYAPVFGYLLLRLALRAGPGAGRGGASAGALAGLALAAVFDRHAGFVPAEGWLGPFHSFQLMIGLNLAFEPVYAAAEGALGWRYLVWLPAASAGLCLYVLWQSLARLPVAAGPVLAVFALVFVFHQAQTRQNYHYLLGATAAWVFAGGALLSCGMSLKRACVLGLVGLMLHWHFFLYAGHLELTLFRGGFRHAPAHAGVRWLSRLPAGEVKGVWLPQLHEFAAPGYVHLGLAVPYYHARLGRGTFGLGRGGYDWQLVRACVSHVVAGPGFRIPAGAGFERVRNLPRGWGVFARLDASSDAPVAVWKHYRFRVLDERYEHAVRGRFFPRVGHAWPWLGQETGFPGFAFEDERR